MSKEQINTVNMGKHTVSVMSQITEAGTQNHTPILGTKCTKNYYTDRHACTVVSVQKKMIGVRNNKTKTIDYYAGTYQVFDELEGHVTFFTKRKNGRWVRQGEDMQHGLGLSIGVHNHYIDPEY